MALNCMNIKNIEIFLKQGKFFESTLIKLELRYFELKLDGKIISLA